MHLRHIEKHTLMSTIILQLCIAEDGTDCAEMRNILIIVYFDIQIL
jgi:hypothetical protein